MSSLESLFGILENEFQNDAGGEGRMDAAVTMCPAQPGGGVCEANSMSKIRQGRRILDTPPDGALFIDGSNSVTPHRDGGNAPRQYSCSCGNNDAVRYSSEKEFTRQNLCLSNSNTVTDRHSEKEPAQRDLFSGGGNAVTVHRFFDDPEKPVTGLPSPRDLGRAAEMFHDLSLAACGTFIEAWLHDAPPEMALLRFARSCIAGGIAAGIKTEAGRRAAESAAFDRGNSGAAAVLEAAYKVRRETDRMRGFLRFSPDNHGVYAARFAPDHFVLPALAEHFSARFGDTPWSITDEKRGLTLVCLAENRPLIINAAEYNQPPEAPDTPSPARAHEKLWQIYHRAINNEARGNPALQKRFLPRRYRKYLTEFPGGAEP